jgi:hypothetical protein
MKDQTVSLSGDGSTEPVTGQIVGKGGKRKVEGGMGREPEDAQSWSVGKGGRGKVDGGSTAGTCADDPRREVELEFPDWFSAKQEVAAGMLIEGFSTAVAAEAAGVCRSTVWRWMNKDTDFMAFVLSERGKQNSAVKQGGGAVALLTAEAVAKAIERRDGRAAFGLLRALGVVGRKW